MTRIGAPARPASVPLPAAEPELRDKAPAGSSEGAARFEGQGRLSPADLPAAGNPGAALHARLSAATVESGPERPLRPGVAELYERYGVAEPMGRPRERVLTWAAFVQDFISAAEPGRLAEVMVEKDLRRQVFLLEGILKLYRKEYPELRPVFDEAKKLEDLLGDFKAPRDQLAALEGSAAPPEVWTALQAQAEEAKAALEGYVAERWTPDDNGRIPAVATLLETLGGIDWADDAADRKFLAKKLGKELKEILETPYDMDQLQGELGMHELRRDLRWFPISVESLDGLVQLDETRNPVKAYEPLLETDLARSKFVRLPDASLEDCR